MITPEKQKHTLYQGATWEWTYLVTDELKVPLDLTGCTAKLMARESIDDTTPVLDVDGVVVGADGKVTFTIPPTLTVTATWEQAVFDVELTFLGGRIEKLAVGQMKLVREVTRV